jgi:AhpD family alkylhydroperoxidase
MKQRINALEKGKEAMKALYGVAMYLTKSRIEKSLLDLVYFRVSQMNGCAFCLDMHAKDLRVRGESEQRLYGLDAWQEAPYYTDRERAALAWAESVTNVQEGHVPDEVYEQVRKQFSEEELVDLTLGVTTINSANRLNIAFRTPAGNYQPGHFEI